MNSRRIFPAVACLFACLSAAPAQGQGVIEGKLVNQTDPKIVPSGVEIDVIQLGAGMSVVKSAVSDARGQFRIEGLPTGGPLLVRANYQSVNYHGRVAFSGDTRASVEITVFETTTSWKGIRAERVLLGFQNDGEHLRALETYTFVNQTEPKRTFMSLEGTFRFSKPEGIAEVPQMTATGPGAAMPLRQSPLESADGKSYYSLYPLRPGNTKFEVEYTLPYHERSYTFRKKFFQDLESFQVGVSPRDMSVSGAGLAKVHDEEKKNIAVYSGGPAKAGAEIAWTFSGGTPSAASRSGAAAGESKIKPMPNDVGQNALLIGPLLLMALVVVLWYAHNTVMAGAPKGQDSRTRELKARRDTLVEFIARLDEEHEKGALARGDYQRRREAAKRQLRRVSMLLGKK
ncbi:MAG: hypothetical protein DMG07_13555 [Acidobacteria bacterium]|nr:MAG: hypothetical protein DMG07_13555 [Acidobacteriota bacterium]